MIKYGIPNSVTPKSDLTNKSP